MFQLARIARDTCTCLRACSWLTIFFEWTQLKKKEWCSRAHAAENSKAVSACQFKHRKPASTCFARARRRPWARATSDCTPSVLLVLQLLAVSTPLYQRQLAWACLRRDLGAFPSDMAEFGACCNACFTPRQAHGTIVFVVNKTCFVEDAVPECIHEPCAESTRSAYARHFVVSPTIVILNLPNGL